LPPGIEGEGFFNKKFLDEKGYRNSNLYPFLLKLSPLLRELGSDKRRGELFN